jgi:hypothetical protein
MMPGEAIVPLDGLGLAVWAIGLILAAAVTFSVSGDA